MRGDRYMSGFQARPKRVAINRSMLYLTTNSATPEAMYSARPIRPANDHSLRKRPMRASISAVEAPPRRRARAERQRRLAEDDRARRDGAREVEGELAQRRGAGLDGDRHVG